jgi:hypothetical protein
MAKDASAAGQRETRLVAHRDRLILQHRLLEGQRDEQSERCEQHREQTKCGDEETPA